jgi:hypothetical protein
VRGVDDVAPVRRDVIVEPVRKILVEVRDHRVLLVRVEVLGLVEDALERHAVRRRPRYELRGAPVVFLLKWVRVGDLRELREARADPEVREVHERALGDQVHVGVLRLLRIAVGEVAHDDLLGRLLCPKDVVVESTRLRDFAERAEQEWLRGIDGAVVVAAVEVQEAEGDVLLAA